MAPERGAAGTLAASHQARDGGHQLRRHLLGQSDDLDLRPRGRVTARRLLPVPWRGRRSLRRLAAGAPPARKAGSARRRRLGCVMGVTIAYWIGAATS